MRFILTFFFLGLFSLGLKSQWDLPVTFEDANEVINWTTFANNDIPDDLNQIENPSKGGINTSDYCCEFIIDSAATKWVGAWANMYGYTAFTESRHIMEVMVYSSSIHTIGVRGQNPLEPDKGTYGVVAEAQMTKTNEWELLTLDLSASIGITYSTLVFFADLNENRTQGSTLYWDNLGWVEGTMVEGIIREQLKVYPNPVVDRVTIEYPRMCKITLTNIQGRQVFLREFIPVETKIVDLSALKPGVYILRIDSDAGVANSRIIKQ